MTEREITDEMIEAGLLAYWGIRTHVHRTRGDGYRHSRHVWTPKEREGMRDAIAAALAADRTDGEGPQEAKEE